jgi:hypothetical protein
MFLASMDTLYNDSPSDLILDQRRAQDEFTLQLVDAISPPILQGFVSLQQAAIKLCEEQGESEKYLMMFQNMIARIPGWNATLITKEVERIKESSQIGYLSDLVTAVHIIHLRILSSVRVGAKPKHIELDPPDFERFIHKVYCECGRKMWTHAYLLRTDVNDIDFQRNMHECEKLIRDAVVSTIRATLPVENILRAYIEEAEEIKVEEEVEAVEDAQQQQTGEAVEEPALASQRADTDEEVKKLVNTGLDVLSEADTLSVHDLPTESINPIKTGTAFGGEEPEEVSTKPSVGFAPSNEVLDMGTNKKSVVDMAPPPRAPLPAPGPPLEEVPLRSFSAAPTGSGSGAPPAANDSTNIGGSGLEVIDLNQPLTPLSIPTLKLDMSDI